VFRRSRANEPVNIGDKRAKVGIRVHSLGPKRCLKAGHQKRSADTFTANITYRDSPAVVPQGNKIVVVATDAPKGFVKGSHTLGQE